MMHMDQEMGNDRQRTGCFVVTGSDGTDCMPYQQVIDTLKNRFSIGPKFRCGKGHAGQAEAVADSDNFSGLGMTSTNYYGLKIL